MMNEYTPIRNFYALQEVLSFIQENPLPENEAHIDVIEILPPTDDQIDVEDFDDCVSDGEDLDPTSLLLTFLAQLNSTSAIMKSNL